MFTDKVLLITGGSGSFGNKVLEKFLDSDLKEIRILSRDEKKQDDMRKKFSNDKIKFYIGDVRDINSIVPAVCGADFIFHAAALKQVPTCEFFPMEAVKTNIIGTNNLLDVAIKYKVKKVICLSTDKAAYPINAMGTSKAMMEKIVLAKARTLVNSETVICLTRYGNVMGSRGSVIPLFYDLVMQNKPLTITNPEMTRYMMTLEEAVELVVFAFENGNQGDLFMQKSPATTVDILAQAICKYKNVPVNIEIIGTRHGEKHYEVLVTKEEMARAEDIGNYYRVSLDQRDLNYKKLESGNIKVDMAEEYNSYNTRMLGVDETVELLKRMGDVE